tara:strand:+ start:7444 stop:7569 length:126 start_codon:yes stop_codon:yes gene_type:complete
MRKTQEKNSVDTDLEQFIQFFLRDYLNSQFNTTKEGNYDEQ